MCVKSRLGVPRLASWVRQQCYSTANFASSLNELSNTNGKPVAIVSKTNEIHFNLALENFLMDVIKPTVPLFFWWQNRSNVVIGRHQNPWKECDLDQMQRDGVDLARRFSGGGAVYQDLGNSCFTFLVPDHIYQQSINNSIILNALQKAFNINGQPSGRNDLIVNGKKFSGSAFKHVRGNLTQGDSRGLSLHHGTLLINTDFTALQRYLTPNKLKLQSKGINSVASRVVNLKELAENISHEQLQAPLIEEFYKQYTTPASGNGTCENQQVIVIDNTSEFTQDDRFQSIYNSLRDWDWRFGKTPQFSHRMEDRFDTATVDLNIDVQNGKISAVKMFTDSLIPDIVPKVEAALLGALYTVEGIDERFNTVDTGGNAELGSQIQDVKVMIKRHILL